MIEWYINLKNFPYMLKRDIISHSLKRNKEDFELPFTSPVNQKTSKKQNQVIRQKTATTEKDKLSIIHEAYKNQIINLERKQHSIANEVLAVEEDNMVDEIQKILNEDIKLTRIKECKYSQHLYYKGMTRILNFPQIGIPPLVSKLYEEEKVKKEKINFKQGILEISGYLYYAIQKLLVLFKFKDLVEKDIEDVPYSIIQTRNIIYTVKEINDKNKAFPLEDNLVLISHPWQLQFYSWTNHQTVPGLKKLKVLNLIKNLNAEKVTHFDYSSTGIIYYFDEQGRLHQLMAEEIKKMFILNTGRYSLHHHVNNSHNTYEVIRKKGGNLELFKNCFRSMWAVAKLCYSYKMKVKGMFCDRKRKLLFGLVEKKTWTIWQTEIQNFIICYQITDSSIKFIYNISEEGLLEEVKPFCRIKQIKISAVEPVNVNYNRKANLCVILLNGERLFFEVSEGGFEFLFNIESPQQKIKNSCQRVLSHHQDTEEFLAILCNDLDSHSYKSAFLAKKVSSSSDSFDREHVSEIQLKIVSEPTQDNQVFKIRDESMMNIYKKNYIKLKNKLCRMNNIHQLNEQVLKSPSFYVFLSNVNLQYIVYVRPIDILFTLLFVMKEEQSIFCFKIIKEVFLGEISEIGNNNIDILELSSMLVQICVDNDGSYYFCRQIIHNLLQKQSKNKQLMKGKRKVDLSQSDQMIRCLRKFSSSESKLYHAWKLGETFTSYLIHMFNFLSQNSFLYRSNKQKEEEFITEEEKQVSQKILFFKLNAILLYLARIIRIIWNQKIRQMEKSQITFLLSKLSSIQHFIQKMLQNSPIQVSSHQRVTSYKKFLNKLKSVLQAIDNLPFLPDLTFKQVLLKERDVFSPYIFLSIEKKLRSVVLQNWIKLFPEYVDKKIIRFINIYEEIEQVFNQNHEFNNQKEKVLEILKRSKSKMPQYFINYLTNTRAFTTHELSQFTEFKQLPELFHIPPTLMKNIKNKQVQIKQRVDNIKTEIGSRKMNLRERYMLIPLLNKNISMEDQQSEEYKVLIFEIILQFQLHKFFKESKKEIDESITNLLAEEQFQIKQIKKLIQKSNSNFLKILSEALIGDDQQILPSLLQNTFLSHIERNQSFQNVKAQIKQEIRVLLIRSHFKISLKPLLQIVDELLVDKIPILQIKMKQYLEFKQISQISSDLIWLPQYLLQIGYPSSQLFGIYYKLLLQQSASQKNQNSLILFYLRYLCCYVIVRDYSGEDKNCLSKKLDSFLIESWIKEDTKVAFRMMLTELK